MAHMNPWPGKVVRTTSYLYPCDLDKFYTMAPAPNGAVWVQAYTTAGEPVGEPVLVEAPR